MASSQRGTGLSKILKLSLISYVFAAGFFLAGCSLTPAKISESNDKLEPIEAADITVLNISPNRSDIETKVLSSEFLAMPSDFTNPVFPELVNRRLNSSLTASGIGASYKISLIRADLLVKTRVADSIPFIGLGSMLMDRSHKCLIEALLETNGESRRRTFESVDNLPGHWVDTSVEEREEFIENCLTDLSQQVRLSLLQLSS